MDARTILLNLKVFGDEKMQPRNGRLVLSTEVLEDADSAMERLRDVSGEGWLCTVDSEKILRFSPQKPLEDGVGSWPLHAEVAQGNTSLHLVAGERGFNVTTIRREDEGAEIQDILLPARFKARDGQGDLLYEVFWSPVDADGFSELRPKAYRFLGFDKN